MTRWKKQTELWDPEQGTKGNCVKACVASLLDIPMSEVPEFQKEKNFYQALWSFFEGHGYYVLELYEERATAFKGQNDSLYIACGQSPRDVSHAVVYSHGRLFFDPHPSGQGIKSVEEVSILIPLDPAFPKKGVDLSIGANAVKGVFDLSLVGPDTGFKAVDIAAAVARAWGLKAKPDGSL